MSWGPRSPDDLRGRQCYGSQCGDAVPSGAIRARGRVAPGKRRGSQLADESLAKRRLEGT